MDKLKLFQIILVPFDVIYFVTCAFVQTCFKAGIIKVLAMVDAITAFYHQYVHNQWNRLYSCWAEEKGGERQIMFLWVYNITLPVKYQICFHVQYIFRNFNTLSSADCWKDIWNECVYFIPSCKDCLLPRLSTWSSPTLWAILSKQVIKKTSLYHIYNNWMMTTFFRGFSLHHDQQLWGQALYPYQTPYTWKGDVDWVTWPPVICEAMFLIMLQLQVSLPQ
jgi:hypothetical protein